MKQQSSKSNSRQPGRGASISPLAALGLSFGYAVGWGAFVLPGTVFLPGAGPLGTLIGIAIGAAVMAVLALNYHRLVLRAPGPGGAYGFVTKIFGPDHGFLLAWFLCLTYIAILWANATAIVLLARFLFGNAFQFGFHYMLVGFDVYLGEVLLSLATIILCASICIFRRRFAISLNAFLAFAMLAGVLVCFAAATAHHKGGLASMAPAFAPGGIPTMEILRTLAMIPWAFVGFEAIVHSSEEFAFRDKRTLPILLAAVAISALLYSLLVLLPVVALPEGYASWAEYIEQLPYFEGIDSVPVFSAARKVLGRTGIAVIGGAMFAGQLTAIFATFIALGHMIRAMALDGIAPRRYARLNGDGTPANAILLAMGVSLVVPFLGRSVIGWPMDISSLGAAIAYCYVSAAAFAVAKSSGKRKEPFARIAGLMGFVMSVVFCLLMIVPNYIAGETLSAESYLILSIWCILGFLRYRRVFSKDTRSRFGHSTVVWVSVLVAIFFSSLMWFRLSICDSAQNALEEFEGKRITAYNITWLMENVNRDMLQETFIEMCILIASLAIMLNLFSIQRRRENDLVVEKLEAEESASKAKSYFFSTVSHDIRTPLNAIVGFTQMLKIGFNTDAERDLALNAILASGKALTRLVNDVLDFSKLEDGSMEFVEEPTDCSKMLEDVTGTFQRASRKHEVEFRCHAGGIPVLIVDPQRIRQLLYNIVGNAAKFTEAGFVEVRGSFERGGDGKGTLRIEIEDTGCGIGKEDIQRIATPYVQVGSKLSRNGGTGFGLAICNQLAKAMGGELSVKSELGKGSTFIFTLPGVRVAENEHPRNELVPASTDFYPNLEQPAGEVPAPSPNLEQPAGEVPTPSPNLEQPAGEVPAQKRPQRILIVDDQKMNLMVLKTMLKKLGSFDVVMASNGLEALQILESSGAEPFDHVLTDMWMPEMDGEGLVHAIRANEKLADMPVDVVTADVEMVNKYEAAGFSHILLKPVTIDKLKGIVEQ